MTFAFLFLATTNKLLVRLRPPPLPPRNAGDDGQVFLLQHRDRWRRLCDPHDDD